MKDEMIHFFLDIDTTFCHSFQVTASLVWLSSLFLKKFLWLFPVSDHGEERHMPKEWLDLPAEIVANENAGLKPARNRVGLAFSGGGIRSACFNLGILQALDEKGLLGRVDYPSTVSGGSYVGSWLLSCLRGNPGFRPSQEGAEI